MAGTALSQAVNPFFWLCLRLSTGPGQWCHTIAWALDAPGNFCESLHGNFLCIPKDGFTEVQVPQNAWPMLSSLEGSWCNCQAKTAKSPVAAGVYQAVSSSFPWTESRKTGGRFRHTRSHKLPNTCNCLGVVIHDHIHKSRCDNEGYKSHVSPNMRVRTV